MEKKFGKLTTAAVVAGAGAAVVLAKKVSRGKKAAEKPGSEPSAPASYQNTELGKHEKNRKGIYYTNGNYEAFARPEKPEGVENKSAYIVGSGLAALAAACFLVRDGQMPGDHIHILEAMDVAGGACDGIFDPSRGYVMRGGREMEDHFECLWDLFRSIPSLEKPGASACWMSSTGSTSTTPTTPCAGPRWTGVGTPAPTENSTSARRGCMEIMKLFMTPDEDLYDKTIEDVFDDEVFSSTFWLYWRTMFAFENWHSALEMKLYFQRFIHHIAGLPDFSALKFTRYNQYESLILPMQKYLEAAGVDFRFGTEVTNVIFDIRDGRKMATAIECRVNGAEQGIVLTENDLVFVTNGSCTERDHLRRPGPRPQRGRGGAHQRLLEPVEEHRQAGPCLWPSGEVLLRHFQDQLGVGHHHHPGRHDPPLYHQHLQAGPPHREGGHRRHRQLSGLQVAAELDHQPPGPVQGAGAGDRCASGCTASLPTCPATM